MNCYIIQFTWPVDWSTFGVMSQLRISHSIQHNPLTISLQPNSHDRHWHILIASQSYFASLAFSRRFSHRDESERPSFRWEGHLQWQVSVFNAQTCPLPTLQLTYILYERPVGFTSKLRDIGGRAHFLFSFVAMRSISALIWDSFIPPILFILKRRQGYFGDRSVKTKQQRTAANWEMHVEQLTTPCGQRRFSGLPTDQYCS